jgi:putative hemolysin
VSRTVVMTFDGEVFRPTEPLDLPAHTRYRVTIDDAKPDTAAGQEPGPFDRILALAEHLGVSDLAEQHDHYLHGTPKR